MGVMIYELLAGVRPWYKSDLRYIQTATFKFPYFFDKATREFISGCLTINPNKRIGCGEGEDFERAFFELEFFKDKIDIDTIDKQTPPIDQEVVKLINDRINEESDNEESIIDDGKYIPLERYKFHDNQILHDGTEYKGQWVNNKRHGEGTLFKKSNDGILKKVYEGHWKNDVIDGTGTYYDGTDSVKVKKSHNWVWEIHEYTRSATTIKDSWTIKAGLNKNYYLDNRFATMEEITKKEFDDFKYKLECNGEQGIWEHIKD